MANRLRALHRRRRKIGRRETRTKMMRFLGRNTTVWVAYVHPDENGGMIQQEAEMTMDEFFKSEHYPAIFDAYLHLCENKAR
jgi:hypothetical protein